MHASSPRTLQPLGPPVQCASQVGRRTAPRYAEKCMLVVLQHPPLADVLLVEAMNQL